MPNSAAILTIGNAIVDVIAQASDDFVTEQGMMKNAMNLIDAERASQLYQAIGPAIESSGGSAANTAAGIAYLGGGYRIYWQSWRRYPGTDIPA